MKFGFGLADGVEVGENVSAKYFLHLTKRSEQKLILIEEIENNGARVFVDPVLPDNWHVWSEGQKLDYIEANKFELVVSSIFVTCEADRNLIHAIGHFEEVETLFFKGGIAQIDDFKLISCLKNIKYLLLRGYGFNDSIVETLRCFEVIHTLDIFETNISKNAIDELKNLLPSNCVVCG